MRFYTADLHVHTILSPCAAIEMTPRNIIWHAAREKIDIVAITDHNACDNVMYAMEAAKTSDIVVLPGMEVESKEEIHFIVLFEKMRQLKEWERFVHSHRSGRKNDEKRFGAQFVVDAEDNLVSVKDEMLLGPLNADAATISAKAAELNGILIASHIDRPVYSLIHQLGFIPDNLTLTAVEVSRRIDPRHARQMIAGIDGIPVITASDAHTLEDFVNGPKIKLYMEKMDFAEIKMALTEQNQRKVVF